MLSQVQQSSRHSEVENILSQLYEDSRKSQWSHIIKVSEQTSLNTAPRRARPLGRVTGLRVGDTQNLCFLILMETTTVLNPEVLGGGYILKETEPAKLGACLIASSVNV